MSDSLKKIYDEEYAATHPISEKEKRRIAKFYANQKPVKQKRQKKSTIWDCYDI